jgi:hypothetical protein
MHRRDVSACELGIGENPSTLAVATRNGSSDPRRDDVSLIDETAPPGQLGSLRLDAAARQLAAKPNLSGCAAWPPLGSDGTGCQGMSLRTWP